MNLGGDIESVYVSENPDFSTGTGTNKNRFRVRAICKGEGNQIYSRTISFHETREGAELFQDTFQKAFSLDIL